jgi:hypothetical protein
VPDTLGWGEVELAASFGVLRFSFVLTSICALTLASSLFVLWNAGATRPATAPSHTV